MGALTREADLTHFGFIMRLLAAVAVEKHNRNIPADPVQQLPRPESRPRCRLKHERVSDFRVAHSPETTAASARTSREIANTAAQQK